MEIGAGRGFNIGPLFIALAAFLWTTDAFVRSTLKEAYTPNQLVTIEHAIIIVILTPILIEAIPKLAKFDVNEWGALLFIGIGGSAIATIALTTAFFMGDRPYQYAAVIVLLQQTQPIIAIGLAHFVLKEKLPKFYYPLSIAAIIGVYLIVSPILTGYTNTLDGLSIIPSSFKDQRGMQASMLGLLAAVLWGSSTVFGRYLLEHSKTEIKYKEMTSYRFLIAFIFLLVLLYIPNPLGGEGGGTELFQQKIDVLAQLLYLAIVVGLLSLLLYYFGLKRTHASVATLFELAYPLSLFILLPIFNGKALTLIQLIGTLILVSSTTILSYLYSSMNEMEKKDDMPHK